MRYFAKWLVLALGLMIGVVGLAAPAQAQATRTWISGVGDDANPCSRTAPCKTFAGAISKTAAGGEINCLDPGGFGAVTITKSITLYCEHTIGGILVTGTHAININASGAIVNLVGLNITGPLTSGGLNGVNIARAASVRISNCYIRGMTQGSGIYFAPSDGGSLYLDNVTITESGNTGNTTTSGVMIAPPTNQTAKVSIRNSNISHNINAGVRTDTSGGTGQTINLSVENASIVGNSAGMLVKVPANTGNAKIVIANSAIVHNSAQGIISNTGTAGTSSVIVGDTTITGNNTGLLMVGLGAINSYGDNRLDDNTVNGTFSAIILKE